MRTVVKGRRRQIGVVFIQAQDEHWRGWLAHLNIKRYGKQMEQLNSGKEYWLNETLTYWYLLSLSSNISSNLSSNLSLKSL